MKTSEELQNDVREELNREPELRNVATEIGIAVKDGVVTLSGNVDTYRKKLAAEKAAQRVAGVKVVASDIEVRLTPVEEKTDTEIAEAVKNALKWNSAMKEDQIEVRSWSEKREAESVAWAAPGVLNVENKIEIDVAAYA